MRLDKFLSNSLSKSRSEIKKIIKANLIFVNNVCINNPNFNIDENNDYITYKNIKLEYNEFIYLMMNKPKDVISSTFDIKDKTVIDLLNEKEKYHKPFPVGRLDRDTVGLLILTNDGKLSHNLLSPKKHIPKTYYVKHKKILSNTDIEKLEKGVYIDDYLTKPCQIEVIDEYSMNLTIYEGKYHQVKKMLESIDNKVIYLKRIKMGNLKLDPLLNEGEYRYLSNDEIDILKGIK